jgi:hypothetical protein
VILHLSDKNSNINSVYIDLGIASKRRDLLLKLTCSEEKERYKEIKSSLNRI